MSITITITITKMPKRKSWDAPCPGPGRGPDDTWGKFCARNQGIIEIEIEIEIDGDPDLEPDLDLDENIVFSDSKTVAVETKSSFAEEFTLPTWIKEGTYIFKANVSTLDGSKWNEASRTFNVLRVSESDQRIIEYVMAAALIFTGGVLIFEHRRVSKMRVSSDELKKFIRDLNMRWGFFIKHLSSLFLKG